MTKICKECGSTRPIEEFKIDKRSADNLATTCNYCLEKREQRAGEDPHTYEAMYIEQKFRCKICNSKVYLSKIRVDHDPETGEVKGLLCVRCNRLLRRSGRDLRVLRAAVGYLAPKPEPTRVGGPPMPGEKIMCKGAGSY